jgi:cellulose biosynthesis protein BcsQ
MFKQPDGSGVRRCTLSGHRSNKRDEMGIIVSVVNNKGGCGKSTTTYNLADALGRRDRRVLVIDMDPQCNTTSILFPKDRSMESSVYQLLDSETPRGNIDRCIYPTVCSDVSIIPNIPETGGLEPSVISLAPRSFFRLRESLRSHLIHRFDAIFIDNPPNMGAFVRCSLYASDFAIVPIKAGSTFSIEGLIRATRLIEEIREEGNPGLRFLRLLVNAVDNRTAICRALINQIRDTFDGDQIFKTEIPINTSFEKAESMRETIFQYDHNAKGTMAFQDLAEEFISIVEK